MSHKRLWIIAGIGLVLGIALMILTGLHSDSLGGDALSGRIVNGQYYVLSGQTEYREVPKPAWIATFGLWAATLAVLALSFGALFVAVLLDVIVPRAKHLFGADKDRLL